MPSLQITRMMVKPSKYNIKCPYSMKPTYITRHDTYNDASAMSEISYMIGNNNQVSYHYAVDDYRAVQGIETNRNAWHCGDGGSGTGNRNSIGVETCYSKSGGERYTKAADNALTLIAMLMKEHGIPVTNVVYHQHWSGKYCPHRTLDMGISEVEYRQLVQARYAEMYGGGSVIVNPIPPTGNTHKVGDVVTINGVYTSSGSNTKLHPAKSSGKITKIVTGARNPYLLDNGNLGWVNDDCITSGKPSTGGGSKPSSGRDIGDIVNINGLYTSSTSTEKLHPAKSSGKITDIAKGARNPYLLDNGNLGWVNESCITSGGSKPSTGGGSSKPSGKIGVGSTVYFNGKSRCYANAAGGGAGATPPAGNYKVKYYSKGAKCAVHIGDWGWVPESTCSLKGSSSKPSTGGKIKEGSTVVVTNPVDVNGTHLAVSGTYKVTQLNGTRAVISKGNTVIAAINVNNLRLA